MLTVQQLVLGVADNSFAELLAQIRSPVEIPAHLAVARFDAHHRETAELVRDHRSSWPHLPNLRYKHSDIDIVAPLPLVRNTKFWVYTPNWFHYKQASLLEGRSQT